MHFYLTKKHFDFVGFVLHHPSGSPLGEANGPMDEEERSRLAADRRSIYNTKEPKFVIRIPEGSAAQYSRIHPQISLWNH